MPVRFLPLLALLCATAGYAANGSDKYYESASKHYFEANYESALIELKNALQLDPEHVPSLLLTGQSHLATSDYSAAEEALIKARVLGADASLVNLLLAEVYLEQANYQSIIDELPTQNLSGAPKVRMLGYIAMAWLGLGNEPEAAASIEQADRIDPDALQPNLARILLHMNLGELEAAQQVALRLISLYPDNWEAFNSLGSTLHAQGKLQAALEHYAKAISLNADAVKPRVARVGLLLDLKQYSRSLSDLDYLDRNYPYEPRAAYLRGLAYMNLATMDLATVNLDTTDVDYSKKYPEEFKRCTEIVAQLPPREVARDKQIAMSAALAHYSLGEFESSKEYLELYLKQAPFDLGANRLLGKVLVNLNDPLRAIQVLKSARHAYPGDRQLTRLLASAYTQAGDHNKASSLLRSLKEAGLANQETDTQLAVSLLQSGYTDAGIQGLSRVFNDAGNMEEAGYTLTIAQLRDDRHEEALDTIEALLANQPDNPTYQNLKAVILHGMGQLDAAEELLMEISARHPSLIPPRLNLAKTRELLGNTAESRKALLQLKQQHPDNANVLLTLAQLEFREGNDDEAMRLAEAAKQLDPTNFAVRKLLVDLYLANGAHDSAEHLALETIQIRDNDFDSGLLLAKAYSESGNQRKAILIYRRIVKDVGFNTERLYQVAQLLLKERAWTAARHALFKALEGDSTHLPSQIEYIRIQLRLGEYEDALQRSLALIEQIPGDTDGYLLAAEANFGLRRFSEAQQLYEKGLAIDFGPSLVAGLYRALSAQNKMAEAGRIFSEMWTRNDAHPIVGEIYSEHLLAARDWSGARNVMATLLEREISSASLLNNMAYALHKLKDNSALDYARQAQRLNPQDPVINDTLGWILLNRNQPESALGYLRQAVARQSDNPEIRYHLGLALHRTGRISEARKEFEAAIRLGVPFEGETEARKLLNNVTDITNSAY